MATFFVKYQTLRGGKPQGSGVSSVAVTANTMAEARQKFNAQHVPSSATAYRIIAVVRQ